MKTKITIMLCLLPAILMGQETRELSLQNTIDSALQNNYGIITQQISADIAQEQNSWGKTGALPNITFVGSAADSRTFSEEDQSVTTSLNSTVDLNWTIFRGFSARS